MSAGSRGALVVGMRVPDAFRARLAARHDVLGPFETSFGDGISRLPGAEASRIEVAVVYGTSRVTREVIARLPALRLVCCVGSGYEGVDLAAAREHGILVTNGRGTNASSVADLAVGLMIASVRGIAEGDAFVRAGEWVARRPRREVRGLTGRRVGIYGLGAIGTKIARRCEALEMEVGYHGRAPHDGVRYGFHPTLAGLAMWADVLVVAVRADAGNRHAVDAGVLAALGRDGHVVNISRGSAIDEEALVEALRAGVIAGAGLDVFDREPEVPAALLAMRQVVMTPHIGGDTHEAQSAMRDAVLANVEAFVAHGRVLTPVPGMPAALQGAR